MSLSNLLTFLFTRASSFLFTFSFNTLYQLGYKHEVLYLITSFSLSCTCCCAIINLHSLCFVRSFIHFTVQNSARSCHSFGRSSSKNLHCFLMRNPLGLIPNSRGGWFHTVWHSVIVTSKTFV